MNKTTTNARVPICTAVEMKKKVETERATPTTISIGLLPTNHKEVTNHVTSSYLLYDALSHLTRNQNNKIEFVAFIVFDLRFHYHRVLNRVRYIENRTPVKAAIVFLYFRSCISNELCKFS